jgi:hypothetical protein
MGLEFGRLESANGRGTHGWTNGQEPMFFSLAGKGKWISMSACSFGWWLVAGADLF